jgi:hypothetical protein
MGNYVGGKPIVQVEKMGVSKISSRIVTLTHPCDALRDVLAKWRTFKSYVLRTHICHANSLFHLYLHFHSSGGSRILYET